MSSDEKIVPIGVVLMTLGTIILFTIISLLLLRFLSTNSNETTMLLITRMPTAMPIILPSPTAELTPISETEQVIKLNPNSVIPSFASVSDAPIVNQMGVLPGQPTRIQIPALNIDTKIDRVGLTPVEIGRVNYYQWGVPENEHVGWHNNSALLGEPGNTVLNGHHNVYGSIFRDLIQLEAGDEIILYDPDNQPHTYVVTQQKLVNERNQTAETRKINAKWIEKTTDERITLVTCWPLTDNSHRLIVVAVPKD